MSSEVEKGPQSQALQAGVVCVWAVCALLYFVLFYSHGVGGANGVGQVARGQFFLRLIVVDDLAREWLGREWTRPAILDRAPILLVAGLLLGAACCAGRLLLAWLGLERRLTNLEATVLAMAVGLNVISLWTLAVGLAGGLRQPLWFWLPTAAVVGAALWRFVWQRSSHEGATPNDGPSASPSAAGGWMNWSALWLAAPFAAFILLGSMLPPTHFDVREYHLQVPKEWFLSGRVEFLPHNIYGNMPLGAEMHPLFAMQWMGGERPWWWGALAGKTVIGCMAPLTALGLIAFGQRFFSVSAGVAAAVIYLATPWIIAVSKMGMIDGAVGMYLFFAFYAIALLWTESADEEQAQPSKHWRPSTSWALLAGFLAGAAVACKYPALLFVAVPMTAAAFICRGRLTLIAGGAFLLALVCGCGLWFAKNWALADNPTYPLLYDVFGGKTLTEQKDAQWRAAHAVPADGQGRRYTPGQLWSSAKRVLYQSDWMSPLLIPFAAMAFWRRPDRWMSVNLLGYFLFVFLAWWLATHRIDRFWVPTIPLLAMLAGAGVNWSERREWRWVASAALAIGLAGNFTVGGTLLLGDNRFFVPLETLRLDVPQTEGAYTRMNAGHRVLNQATPPGWKVLLVGDAQAFDLEVPVLYNTCFDDCWLEKLTKGRTPEEQLAELRQQKIAYIYVLWSELARYRKTYGYSDYAQPSVLHEMVRQGVLLPPSPPFPDVDNVSVAELPPQIFPVAGLDQQ